MTNSPTPCLGDPMVSPQTMLTKTFTLGLLLAGSAGVGALPNPVTTPFSWGQFGLLTGPWMFQAFDATISPSIITSTTASAFVPVLAALPYMYAPWTPSVIPAGVNAVLGGVLEGIPAVSNTGTQIIATFLSRM